MIEGDLRDRKARHPSLENTEGADVMKFVQSTDEVHVTRCKMILCRCEMN